MSVIDIFPIQIICFNFKKHKNYFFLDPGKQSNVPDGWNCDVNSTFPRIPDDDPLVLQDVRDRLIGDIEDSCNAELRREGIAACDISTFWYNAYHGEQDQERHDHMDGMCPTFLSGIYYNSNPTPTTFFPIATHYRSMRYRGIERSGIRESMYDFYHFKPTEGQIILFPPYLEHEVKCSFSDKMRLTFSFNMVLRR